MCERRRREAGGQRALPLYLPTSASMPARPMSAMMCLLSRHCCWARSRLSSWLHTIRRAPPSSRGGERVPAGPAAEPSSAPGSRTWLAAAARRSRILRAVLYRGDLGSHRRHPRSRTRRRRLSARRRPPESCARNSHLLAVVLLHHGRTVRRWRHPGMATRAGQLRAAETESIETPAAPQYAAGGA